MQLADRPRGAHVQHPGALVVGPCLFEQPQVVVSGRQAVCPRHQRSRDKLAFYPVELDLLPEQQRLVISATGAMQAGQNDRIELQPLGFMDSHELQCIGRPHIRRSKQFFRFARQGLQLKLPVLLQPFDQIEERLHVAHVTRVGQADGTAQLQPDRFDPPPGWLPAAMRQGLRQHITDMAQTSLPILAHALQTGVILHQ